MAKLFIEAKSEQIALVDKTTKYKETNLFDQRQIDFGLPSFACDSGGNGELTKSGPTISPKGGRGESEENLQVDVLVGLSLGERLPTPNDSAICQSTGGRMSGCR